MKYVKPELFDFASGARPDCLSGTGAAWDGLSCTAGPTYELGTATCDAGTYVATNNSCTNGPTDTFGCSDGSSARTYCGAGLVDDVHTGCFSGTGPTG